MFVNLCWFWSPCITKNICCCTVLYQSPTPWHLFHPLFSIHILYRCLQRNDGKADKKKEERIKQIIRKNYDELGQMSWVRFLHAWLLLCKIAGPFVGNALLLTISLTYFKDVLEYSEFGGNSQFSVFLGLYFLLISWLISAHQYTKSCTRIYKVIHNCSDVVCRNICRHIVELMTGFQGLSYLKLI